MDVKITITLLQPMYWTIDCKSLLQPICSTQRRRKRRRRRWKKMMNRAEKKNEEEKGIAKEEGRRGEGRRGEGRRKKEEGWG